MVCTPTPDAPFPQQSALQNWGGVLSDEANFLSEIEAPYFGSCYTVQQQWHYYAGR